MSTGVYDSRITAYFGDAVLQAGFMPLPHLFLRHYRELGLSHIQAMFVLQLMEIAWDLSRPPTSISKLAARMDVGHRTIQVCSRELHALGLVDIYDQFDEAGAQVENGYDLSPLFRRLAQFAPVERPRGDVRERRVRIRPGEAESQPSVALSVPPVQESASAPHNIVHRSPIVHCITPLLPDSGLNMELKNLRKNPSRKQQDQQAGGAVVAISTRGQPTLPGPIGYSLRWDTTLDSSDVQHSREVLDRVGLNGNVAAAVAKTLHPAESWALWSYARGAGLGPAWIASQVYDFGRQKPRQAGLASRYDAVGHSLAVLPLTTAQAVIDAADSCCPHDLPGAHAALGTVAADDAVQCALTAVWSVMVEQRGGRSSGGLGARRLTTDAHIPAPSFPLDQLEGALEADPDTHTVLIPQVGTASRAVPLCELWGAALQEMYSQVSQSDWETWLKPTVLLDVDQGEAIVGTPNIFVRQEVEQRYVGLLQGALQDALGQQVRINVVIATGRI